MLRRKVIALHQIEIKQKYPREGWVEQDPKEILQAVIECIQETIKKMKDMGLSVSDIKAIGITNQRETTVVWDKSTGEPLYNAIGMNRLYKTSHFYMRFYDKFLAESLYIAFFNNVIQIIETICARKFVLL